MYDLYIGNKNYSSWSLRAWLLLKHFGIPFREHMVSVAGRDYNAALKPLAGNARVPSLHDDGFQVWESIAIAEYLAEKCPAMWPADPRARARARSISAEMHAGFVALRTAMPMNLKLRLKGKPPAPEVQREIDRIVEIWSEARTQFATGDGPWLFGDFTIADAMYAPIACRFHSYNVPLPPLAAGYVRTVLDHPAMAEWTTAALRECEAHPPTTGSPTTTAGSAEAALHRLDRVSTDALGRVAARHSCRRPRPRRPARLPAMPEPPPSPLLLRCSSPRPPRQPGRGGDTKSHRGARHEPAGDDYSTRIGSPGSARRIGRY